MSTAVCPVCGKHVCVHARGWLNLQREQAERQQPQLERALGGGGGFASIWTGEVRLNEAHLQDPNNWKKPQTVALGFHGDIGLLPIHDISRIVAVTAWARRHQYFALTKRPENILRYCEGMALLTPERRAQVLAYDATGLLVPLENCGALEWPLPWISWGTSASTQPELDARIVPLMKLATSGWRTHLFLEPLIEAVDVRLDDYVTGEGCERRHLLGWVVCGGESGPKARPMHPNWARRVRDDCAAAGVPFWFKGWGRWKPCGEIEGDPSFFGGRVVQSASGGRSSYDHGIWSGRFVDMGDGVTMERVTKKGVPNCLLDSREWKQFPEVKR